MGKRRSSFQQEQETKSRFQLQECLSDFGWHLTSPTPDLGEDFIVEIYHGGENTGINFYIQIKSVTNLEIRKSKTKEELVYPLKVKDLKHWADFSLPVVVCIWDVKIRSGRWAFVRNLILHLNQTNPKWKNRKDVQVYIPWGNATDDNSLKRLKTEIAKHVYPLISSGKDLSVNMKLNFPDTAEGKQLWKAFDLHIKEGEPITLTGDVIQELKFSDWWETWFGEVNPKEALIHIGEISSHLRTVLISFKIIPTKGKTVGISNVEFRFIRVGTELIKLNNEHTSHPVLLNLDIRKIGDLNQINVSYTLRHFGGEPNEILGLLDFAKAMSIGGKLQITFLEAEKSFTSDIAGLPTTLNTFPEPALYELVQKLCFIQDKIGQFFQIPKDGILVKDADAISELFEIFKNGITHYANATSKFGLKGKGLEMLLDVHKQGKPIHFKSIAQESFIELFELDVSLGPMIRDITGFIKTDPIELEEIIKKLDIEEFLNITLVNANGTETFTNWYPSEIQELE